MTDTQYFLSDKVKRWSLTSPHPMPNLQPTPLTQAELRGNVAQEDIILDDLVPDYVTIRCDWP